MAKKQKSKGELKSEGERIQRTMETPGWDLIEKAFTDELMDIQSIQNIDSSSGDKAIIDLKSRNMAVKKMMNWWKKIHGSVERKAFLENKSKEGTFIRQFGEED